MEYVVKELGIPNKNIFPTTSSHLFNVVVHNCWLKKWLKNEEVESNVNIVDFALQPGESVPYPWKKVFVRVINKKISKVLPLPRYKLSDGNKESPLIFPQLLQYVSQTNHRNLWKEAYKKYCQSTECSKESAIVNLMEHDHLLSEVILRLYGCNIIRIKTDSLGKLSEYKEIIPNKYVSKSYETHVNLLPAMFALETDTNFFIVFQGQYEHNLLDCLNSSPNLIDKNYCRGLFVLYQILNVSKALSDRGLSLGTVGLQDIFLTENLWLQVLPQIYNNVHVLDASLIYEHTRSRQSVAGVTGLHSSPKKSEELCWREKTVQLEKLCILWVKGRISNLDYLLHLNVLAGRSSTDPQAHFIVPWVTDFASRCGRNWRDLSKSKYRLTKGDRQLDLTYEVGNGPGQIPHHVSDPLSDITCYVYLARRTQKEVLCKYVRNKWVPAEYPGSIQRMQEWTPDECIPEFYTDPAVFKSIHEDLPNLCIPSWSTCVEDFIMKHREALESSYVSENLHHWIDITFGYKLSGVAAVKAKNVCLSLVDAHSSLRRGAPVQLLLAPHPSRARCQLPPPAPPPLRYITGEHKKPIKTNDSSDEISEEDEESISVPQHVSRLHVPVARVRTRQKSSSRARSLSKHHDEASSGEVRASSHSRHYKVQKSELGKGVIYLPKEFNPVASIQALEILDNFRTKCFFTRAEDAKEKSMLNTYPVQKELRKHNVSASSIDGSADDNSFTNHMFLYEQSYLKKFTHDTQIDSVLKERKNRSFNTRYTTDAAVYKQFITETRRRDMLVIGCLIVEIFLHTYMRPLRIESDNFDDRYNCCRMLLKYNFNAMPKCVSYVASLLLNVQPPSLSFRSEISPKGVGEDRRVVVTDKGLPPPTAAQMLQPLLMQHLIPFPLTFNTLYSLLSTLHEYQLTSNELNILYMYECDGTNCEKYKTVDKTKLHFSQRIAEGKVQACASHLDVMLGQVNSFSQFDVLDIFLTHYIELLNNKDTSILAAWYLFDTVSKALGPEESRNKLLKHILNLYEDDDLVANKAERQSSFESGNLASGRASKQKFVKLYHNIFLLQLMVRFGLRCFLDNFTQHLVEAVGGYKDVTMETGTPGHCCHHRSMANKKPRYSDDNVKSALSTNNDIFSPDTSYGSENIATPSVDKIVTEVEVLKERDADSRSESELFHFESDKDRMPSRSSRSKSPAGSVDSYTLSTTQHDNQTLQTPSPSTEIFSPLSLKEFSPDATHFASKEINVTVTKDDSVDEAKNGPMSPSIDIPNTTMFTSYLHFAEDDGPSAENVEVRNESRQRHVKSLEFSRHLPQMASASRSLNEEEISYKDNDACKISDMSSESLIWLAHKIGPVLTCRYITRNLLKMLTLCYIGKENLMPCDGDGDLDDFDVISIAKSRVVGDRNASKVIKCLTSIVAMYGSQLIMFQYLAHTRELIASCRRRLSAPLQAGCVACLQLCKCVTAHMSLDQTVLHLQDTLLKSILHPALRLASTARCTFPDGSVARTALCRKLVDALYALALRIGPEMTRRHIAVPALQRFFLAFDKAAGKTDNWPKHDSETSAESKLSDQDGGETKVEGFLEICRDGSTAEWAVRDGAVVREDAPPDIACSPPSAAAQPPPETLTAQEELLAVFNDELAHQVYSAFASLMGVGSMERSLSNMDTIQEMCQRHARTHAVSPPLAIQQDKRVSSSLSDEPLNRSSIDIAPPAPPSSSTHLPHSNSFGSNVTLVGNRIDVASEAESYVHTAFRAVAYNADAYTSDRHLRGDWLIYWEHEIGRSDKQSGFNLKQIKLQTFAGHTHCVKCVHCLDNESSFMSGSKDKTVKLWSLRNQGDGSATTQCNWTYTGHKKGVLSLTFLESLRLAVSSDSVVHIWDPFMESVVSQLDNIKTPVSIVRTLPGPSTVVVAATTDATLKIIDARACNYTHDLKIPGSASTFVRCVCVSESGRWVACGLASGHVAVLQPRTGRATAAWRAHDGEVLRLTAVDENRLLSSGLDQTMALWDVNDGELITHLKGNTEPVHCLSTYNGELITGSTNNRIGVHTALGRDASFSSTKLRADTFRGVLTALAVLPLNRLLLLASDNGSITAIC